MTREQSADIEAVLLTTLEMLPRVLSARPKAREELVSTIQSALDRALAEMRSWKRCNPACPFGVGGEISRKPL